MRQRLQRYIWPIYVTVLLATASGTFVVEAAMHTQTHTHSHTESFTSTPVAATSACPVPGIIHEVIVTSSGFHPSEIAAKLCDQVRFTNQSSSEIDVAVGPHDHHEAYPGLAEGDLKPGASTLGILRAKGNFELHDHIGDIFHASLTVTP